MSSSLQSPLRSSRSQSGTRTPASGFEEKRMTEYLWMGAVTTLLLVYLAYALLVPEKF
jgi:K+-transporting ATPase KdpF subunit